MSSLRRRRSPVVVGRAVVVIIMVTVLVVVWSWSCTGRGRRRRSSGFKREAIPIKNHDAQSLICWSHVLTLEASRQVHVVGSSLIAPAPADSAGLERRHPQRDSHMGLHT